MNIIQARKHDKRLMILFSWVNIKYYQVPEGMLETQNTKIKWNAPYSQVTYQAKAKYKEVNIEFEKQSLKQRPITSCF